MILPLSDAPNPRGVPVVTYLLIGVNVAVYLLISLPLSVRPVDVHDPALREYVETLLQVMPGVSVRDLVASTSSYDLFVFAHGFRPAAPEWIDLLTSIFLHGGFLHLFGNMLFLWIYGDNVEYRLGRLYYLLVYLLTGVAATAFYMVFAGRSPFPLVGASGAISGVLGFYFLWFPRNTVRLFVFLFPIFMNVIEIPARIVLGIYLIVDNLLPFFLSQGGAGGVAHGAHIGGFLAGLGLGWYLDRRALDAEPEEYRASREASSVSDASETVVRDLERGDYERAAERYFALSPTATRGLLSPERSLELGDWLAVHGHAQAALTVYRRHLRDHAGGAGTAEAHLGAGLIQLHALRQVAPAYQHFLEALESDPSPVTAARARDGLAAVRELQKYHRLSRR